MKKHLPWTTILPAVAFIFIAENLSKFSPIVVLVFDGLSLLTIMTIAIWSRRKLRVELRELWRLADQLGCSTQQIQAMALAAYPQFKYGQIDWALSRGDHPQFFPSRRIVRKVLATLNQLKLPSAYYGN